MQASQIINHFYPRSPRGERLDAYDYLGDKDIFLSTLPARGATAYLLLPCVSRTLISIHAPREGSDRGHTKGHEKA